MSRNDYSCDDCQHSLASFIHAYSVLFFALYSPQQYANFDRRLTNAFSKKLANLKAAVALHFAYYNFCRVHSSLRVTPAMEANLSGHVWSVAELLGEA
jgi:hypothetical protein